VLAIAALAVFTWGWRYGGERVLLPGPLVSAHASLEGDCLACHVPWKGASDSKCIECHGKSFRATQHPDAYHAIAAASGQKSPQKRDSSKPFAEPPCQMCHTEHRGRKELLRRVEDAQCVNCHAFRSLNAGHPAFRPHAGPRKGSLAAIINHKKHMGVTTEKVTCASCHLAGKQANGGEFAPPTFEKACVRCHTLQPTPNLKEWLKPEEVEVLKGQVRVQTRRGRLFKVTREPKEHRDAFVISQLDGISTRLQEIRGGILVGKPETPDERAWEVLFLSAGKKQDLEDYRRLQNLARGLFEPCKDCHTTEENGVPAWSQADFRIQKLAGRETPLWPRARFRHRPHLTLGERAWKESPCEACHSNMRQLEIGMTSSLPSLQTCQGCHTPEKVRNFCQNCHAFHPASATPPTETVRLSRTRTN